MFSNHAVEWYQASGGSLNSSTVYTLATLPTGLGNSAFGNSFFGSSNNGLGAVIFGFASGAETPAQVTVMPEFPGTMLACCCWAERDAGCSGGETAAPSPPSPPRRHLADRRRSVGWIANPSQKKR